MPVEITDVAKAELYLASRSPRRCELLDQIGVYFESLPVDVNESLKQGETPTDYVTRLALDKAHAGWAISKESLALPVLGADTTVVCGQTILGKPADGNDALEMLQLLSGKTHTVMTAVAVVNESLEHVRLVSTQVSFQTLTEKQCRQYWQTGEPADKAGGYGIQGYGGLLVSRLSGSYSAVVGLPLAETAQLLGLFKVSVWNHKA